MRPELPLALLLVATLGGCAELRGRKKIQEGNAAYKDGDFALAVKRFKEAEAFVPDMPLLWLNRGYACREMIVPGANATVNRPAALCALDSFKHLRELAPDDPRGDRLYVQTLLDVGEYKTIERTFMLRHEGNPADLDVVLVLEQVFLKMGRWREALEFYRKAAALRPQDADAQYAVGAFVWQMLQARGGGPASAHYDPRPRPERLRPPPQAPGDIVGPERLALAEEGIRYLGRALELHPRYPNALTYMGLLYRQQSFALFDDVDAWQRAVTEAVAYAARASEKP
jgi:tetratricopeptide (TPR) repeat protein